jgi:hypothetical protein
VLDASVKKEDWLFRGTQNRVEITNITCGYGKDGSTMIGIVTQQGNKTDAYLVNPDISSTAWLWREMPCPVNSLGVIDFRIGHNSKLESIDGVDAIAYVLYQTDKNETALVLTSLPDTSIFNHLIETDINPTAFDIIEDSQNNSQLVIAEKDMYLLSTEAQMAKDSATVSQGTTKLNSNSFTGSANRIELGRVSEQDLQVWIRTSEGDLLQSKSTNGTWDNFFPFEKNVELLASWRNGGSGLNAIFYVSLDNQLNRYIQDPSTTRWLHHPVKVPTLGEAHEVCSYTTHLNITDEDGRGLVDHKVTINCSEQSQLKINNETYYLGQGEHCAVVKTDMLGNILIENTVDSLVTPTLRISVDGIDTPFDLNPMHDVQTKLSGITKDSLKSARMQTTEIGKTAPLFKRMSDEDAKHASDSLNGLTDVANKLPSSAFPSAPVMENAVHLRNVKLMLKAPDIKHEKLGPLFGIDFTQGAPLFSSDHQTLQNVHLKTYNTLMARAESIDMLKSFDDSITHFFGDLWHSIKKGLLAIGHLVVQAVKKGFELIVTLLDGTVLKAIVHFAEQAWEVVSHVLEKIGAAIEDALRWLGELFAWNDILRTHDVIRSLINIGLNSGKEALASSSEKVNVLFNQIRQSISQANGYKNSKASYLTANTKSATAKKGKQNPLGHPQSNWAISHATSSGTLSHAPTDKTANVKIDNAFKQSIEDIKKIMAEAGKEVSDSFESGDVGDVLRSILNLLEEAIISAAELAIQGMLNLAEKALDLLQDVLNHRWNIPLLTPLYENIIAPGSTFSLLDLICLVVAIPATVMYKIGNGTAPFTESTVRAIARCKTFDDVFRVYDSPEVISSYKISTKIPKPLPVEARMHPNMLYATGTEGMSAGSASVSGSAQAGLTSQTTAQPPKGVREFDYVLGYISGTATCIYGIANGIGAIKQNQVTGKIKMVTGIVATVSGITSMGIKLGYTQKSDVMYDWYSYEMFITCYQALFNANDVVAVVCDDTGDEFMEITGILTALIESVLGILNTIFFIILVFGDKDGWKFFQNISMCIAQILAGPTAVDDEPISKGVMAAAIGVTNTGAGIGNLVRTAEAAKEDKVHVNN